MKSPHLLPEQSNREGSSHLAPPTVSLIGSGFFSNFFQDVRTAMEPEGLGQGLMDGCEPRPSECALKIQTALRGKEGK